jgi:predicted DNA-binding protein (UPF0251 family)
MVRPRKIKVVNFEPGVTYFKPRDVPLSKLKEVELTIDELETMRLSNIEKLGQEESAKKMGIHQSTFQRTLTRAREKVTDALVNGKAVKIHGGDYTMPGKDGTGPRGMSAGTGGFGSCGAGIRRGFGRGTGFSGGYGRRRFRFMPMQQVPQTNKQEALQQQISSIEQEEKMLQEEKQELQKRIEGLKQHG